MAQFALPFSDPTSSNLPGSSSSCQNMPERNIIGCPIACEMPAAVSVFLAQAPISIPIYEKRRIPANIWATAIGVKLTSAPNIPMPSTSTRKIETPMIIRYQISLDRIYSHFFNGVVLRILK